MQEAKDPTAPVEHLPQLRHFKNLVKKKAQIIKGMNPKRKNRNKELPRNDVVWRPRMPMSLISLKSLIFYGRVSFMLFAGMESY